MTVFLRQPMGKLQEEMRNTMSSYVQEKQMLRNHLSNLRLDVQELHLDNRTVTTATTGASQQLDDDLASNVSWANSQGSDAELKRLEEVESEAGGGGNVLRLPTLKYGGHGPAAGKRTGTHASKSKSIAFSMGDHSELPAASAVDSKDNGVQTVKSFFGDHTWDMDADGREKQKFAEMQRNQDVLRSIGRANHRDKRQSLIRLPTINSAKRRTTLWDSGKNTSRPKGISANVDSFAYVEASRVLSNNNFKIPKVKDPRRSEIQIGDFKPLGKQRKRKVQFTRPSLVSNTGYVSGETTVQSHRESVMGGESLNTTLADTSMGDTTFGDISIDEDQIKALTQRSMGETKSSNTSITNNTAANTSSDGSDTEPAGSDVTAGNVGGDESNRDGKSKTSGDNYVKNGVSFPSINDNNKVNTKTAEGVDLNKTHTKNTNDDTTSNAGNAKTGGQKGIVKLPSIVPPLKLEMMDKKSSRLRKLSASTSTTARTVGDPLQVPLSDRSSDRSTNTKVSLISAETEQWKNKYMLNPDPDVKNKTLADIMFAVRTRMKENEASLRFGETPRPTDHTLADYLVSKPTKSPRHVHYGTGRKTKVSRRPGGPLQSSRPNEKSLLPNPLAASPGGGAGTHRSDTKRKESMCQVQGYLRKLQRQRQTIDRVAGTRYKLGNFAGHKQLQLVSQKA